MFADVLLAQDHKCYINTGFIIESGNKKKTLEVRFCLMVSKEQRYQISLS